MLVLSRKPKESILIGGNIRITVVRTGEGRTRLGIEAPKDIPIVRNELEERKESTDSENQPEDR